MPINNQPSESNYLSSQAEQTNRNTRAIDSLHKTNQVGPWIKAELLNGYEHGTAPYGPCYYRLNGDRLEFKGWISVENAYYYDRLAFIIQQPFRPAYNMSFSVSMLDTLGESYVNAYVEIIASTGHVTLYWR